MDEKSNRFPKWAGLANMECSIVSVCSEMCDNQKGNLIGQPADRPKVEYASGAMIVLSRTPTHSSDPGKSGWGNPRKHLVYGSCCDGISGTPSRDVSLTGSRDPYPA